MPKGGEVIDKDPEKGGTGAFAAWTEVLVFLTLTDVVARDLQKRLGLIQTPVIHRFCDLGLADAEA